MIAGIHDSSDESRGVVDISMSKSMAPTMQVVAMLGLVRKLDPAANLEPLFAHRP